MYIEPSVETEFDAITDTKKLSVAVKAVVPPLPKATAEDSLVIPKRSIPALGTLYS